MNLTEIHLARHRFLLHPDHALIWPEKSTAFVADLHLGRAEYHRRNGLYLPSGTDADDLQRLTQIICETNTGRVVILGDLFHDLGRRPDAAMERFATWIDQTRAQIILIEGNHDRPSRKAIQELGIPIHSEPLIEEGFLFCHEPRAVPGLHALCGHLHPGVRFRDVSRCVIEAKAFWIRPNSAILPAFGALTGFSRIQRAPEDQIYICGPSSVVEMA